MWVVKLQGELDAAKISLKYLMTESNCWNTFVAKQSIILTIWFEFFEIKINLTFTGEEIAELKEELYAAKKQTEHHITEKSQLSIYFDFLILWFFIQLFLTFFGIFPKRLSDWSSKNSAYLIWTKMKRWWCLHMDYKSNWMDFVNSTRYLYHIEFLPIHIFCSGEKWTSYCRAEGTSSRKL